MRFPRLSPRSSIFLAALCLVSIGGCNRGAHPTHLGKVALDFTLNDGEHTVHLADYRGKVVLLNLWKSNCGPCIQETPGLIALHHEHPELVILSVSTDEDAAAYHRFLNRFRVDYTTVRDPDQTVAKMYGTDGWPETYIIDREGVIRRKVISDPDWSSPQIRAFLQGL